MSGVSFAWNSVQWPRVIGRICRLQRRIYKARLAGPRKRVHWLQNKLIHNFDAKLLAVHLVTNGNKSLVLLGKKERSPFSFTLSGNDKLFLAQKLSIDGKAFPTYQVSTHVNVTKQAYAGHTAWAYFTGCQETNSLGHQKYPLIPYSKRFLRHGHERVNSKGNAPSVAKHKQVAPKGVPPFGVKSKKSKPDLANRREIPQGVQPPVAQVQSITKGLHPFGVKGKKETAKEVKCEKEREPSLESATEDTLSFQLCTVQDGEKPFKIDDISAICDRAKQALALLALEPEWEAIFEPNSFGFRPGRCVHDAIETIFLTLHQKTVQHVLSADIRKCFHKIDHRHLLLKLDTFKLLENQISAWLKAGVMSEFANSDQQSYMASAQGRLISSLLVNIVLHGVENHLTKFVDDLSFRPFSLVRQCQPHLPYPAWACLYPQPLVSKGLLRKLEGLHPELLYPEGVSGHSVCSAKEDYSLQEAVPFTIVRFASEFVIFHAQKPILDLCFAEVQKWLGGAGLETAEKKCFIKDCRQSFIFLGFNIIQIQRKIIVRRSRPNLTQCKAKGLAEWSKSKKAYNSKDTKYVRSVKRDSSLNPNDLVPLRLRSIKRVQGATLVARSLESCEAYESEYKVKITPSRQACFAYLDKVRHIIKKNRQVSTYNLIFKLRPVTIDWANYYRFCDCSMIFRKMGNLVFQMLRHWVFRRHSRENRFSIKEKYWPSGRIYQFDQSFHQNNWVLCGKSYTQGGILTENYLPHMSWFQSRKFAKIREKKGFYNADSFYWAERHNNKSKPKDFTELLKEQNGNCVLCNYYFDTLV